MRTKTMNPVDEPQMQPMDNDPEAGGHLKTLLDAEMIKQDPVKMMKIHALAGRHMAGIKSIQDLKNTYDQKFGGAKAPAAPSTMATKKSKAPKGPAPAPSIDGDGDQD